MVSDLYEPLLVTRPRAGQLRDDRSITSMGHNGMAVLLIITGFHGVVRVYTLLVRFSSADEPRVLRPVRASSTRIYWQLIPATHSVILVLSSSIYMRDGVK